MITQNHLRVPKPKRTKIACLVDLILFINIINSFINIINSFKNIINSITGIINSIINIRIINLS